MKLQSQRAPFLMGAAAALLLTFSTAAIYPQISQSGDATATPAAPSTERPGAATPAAPNSSKGMDNGMGRYGMGANPDEQFAQALGISTEELQAAYLKAANAALDQAVADDLLTQQQADNLRQRLEAASANGFAFHLGGRGFEHFGSGNIDTEALLADALGITTEELQKAYADAEAAALAQAVDNGQITQEQADLMAARQAFRQYLQSQQKSYEELVQEAQDAGAITQDQADLLLQNQQSFGGRGFGMGGDFDFGRGMQGGMMPGGRGGMQGDQDWGRGHNGSQQGVPGGMMPGGRGMHGGQNWGRGQNGGPNGDQQNQQPDSGAQSNSSFTVPSAGL